MPGFFVIAFALAGLAAAFGPLAIHLLHRRRTRVVEWAAMELLREALGERRRTLRLRDLTLLALRTACVLLFALAMARPYWLRAPGAVDLDQPVHAVLLIDNSLSMAYEEFGGTLLQTAKARAREFLEKLPPGSRANVLPLDAPGDHVVWEPYRNLADAVRFLEQIDVVDQEASVATAVGMAARACAAASELPQKRVVLFGDQQAINWPADRIATLGEWPAEIQIVQVAAAAPSNAWVAAFEWPDGLADAETTGNFRVAVGFEGQRPRANVTVTLSVEGTPIATRVIDLEPGETQELSFAHRFTQTAPAGEPRFVACSVKLSPDRLRADDERALVVPVVSEAPVSFVDDIGADEEPAARRFGETSRLQRLLAPGSPQADRSPGLVRIERTKIDELTSESLAASQLVVVAGVEQPGAAAPLLRRYVSEGGGLLIAAGARFDPAAWQAAGWLDGAGILPAPLSGELVGQQQEPTADGPDPLWLDTDSLDHATFGIPAMNPQELADFYHAPLFFQAVAVDDVGDGFKRWAASLPPGLRPRTLARFSNRLPFLIERGIGRGQAMFLASGIGPESNTLSQTRAVVLYDRIVRTMLARRLPRRNLTVRASYSLAIEGAARLDRHFVTRPGGQREALAVEALGDGSFGVTVRDLWRRGVYQISATADEADSETWQGDAPWEVSLAVNGPPRESQLRSLSPAEVRAKLAEAVSRVFTRHEALSPAPSSVLAPDAWKWLLAAVLGLLLVEMVWLGARRNRETRPA